MSPQMDMQRPRGPSLTRESIESAPLEHDPPLSPHGTGRRFHLDSRFDSPRCLFLSRTSELFRLTKAFMSIRRQTRDSTVTRGRSESGWTVRCLPRRTTTIPKIHMAITRFRPIFKRSHYVLTVTTNLS